MSLPLLRRRSKLPAPGLDVEVQAASIGPPVTGGHDERVVQVAREMDIPLQPVRRHVGTFLSCFFWSRRRLGNVCLVFDLSTAAAPRAHPSPAPSPDAPQRAAWEFDEMRDTVDFDLVLVLDRYDQAEVVREVRPRPFFVIFALSSSPLSTV